MTRQIGAILSAAAGRPVNILVPMVTIPGDITAVTDEIEDQCRTFGIDRGSVSVGMMVEVPAAALSIDMFLDKVDFINIGTNDLAQYLFAADRNAAALDEYHFSQHPALLGIVRSAAATALNRGRRVVLCGDTASDPATIAWAIAGQIRAFSMPPSAIPPALKAVRALF
jgi:phosphoenolpyruvate-protein kinase (PTS system EI component)